MIAVDSNLLVYAHREDSSWHAAAFDRLVELAEGRADAPVRQVAGRSIGGCAFVSREHLAHPVGDRSIAVDGAFRHGIVRGEPEGNGKVRFGQRWPFAQKWTSLFFYQVQGPKTPQKSASLAMMPVCSAAMSSSLSLRFSYTSCLYC